MIENGAIITLSNNKKYMITDSTVEDGNIFYLTLELDNITELPTEESVFFKQTDSSTLIPINNINDIDFLKNVFVNKFLENFSE